MLKSLRSERGPLLTVFCRAFGEGIEKGDESFHGALLMIERFIIRRIDTLGKALEPNRKR